MACSRTPDARRMRGWPLFALAIVLTGSCATVRADITGDVAALQTAAQVYRENFNKLVTWSGHVRYTRRSRDLEGGRAQNFANWHECQIEFAARYLDGEQMTLRFSIDYTQCRKLFDDGRTKSRRAPDNVAALLRDGAYYQYQYDKQESVGTIRNIVVREEKSVAGGMGLNSFAPDYFMKSSGLPFDKQWQFDVEEARNIPDHCRVHREGSLVTFTIDSHRGDPDSPTWTQVMTEIIDLGRGGNVVLIESVLTTKANVTKARFEIDYHNVNGVFIPRRAERKVVVTGDSPDDYVVAFVWTDSRVNEPSADDQFTLAKIGVRRGDRLHDNRDGSVIEIDDPTALPLPAPLPAQQQER